MAVASLASLVVTLVLALVAGVAVWVGWRWRREAVAAACRRCGYDVSGRPAGVERCSECGADLRWSKAIVTVRRVRLWRLVAPAAVVAAVLGGRAAYQVATFPWFGYYLANAPVEWIIATARDRHDASGDPYREAWHGRHRTPAFYDHLLDLYGEGRLPVATIFERRLALAMTATTSRAMRVRLEALVGKLSRLDPGPATQMAALVKALPAADVDVLSDAQYGRYAAQLLGATPTFRVRSPIRPGDPLRVRVTGRAASSFPMVRTGIAARFDAPATLDAERLGRYEGLSADGEYTIAPGDAGTASLAPGRHRVHLIVGRMVDVGTAAQAAAGKRYDASGTLDVEVLPAGTPIGTPIVDPSKADEVARAVYVAAFQKSDGGRLVRVQLRRAGVDRAFTIYQVADGQPRRLGAVAARAGYSSRDDPDELMLPTHGPTTGPLTIVLVGDGEALAETIDQQGYWAGRITFEDVPVQWFDDRALRLAPGTRPATRPYRVEAAR